MENSRNYEHVSKLNGTRNDLVKIRNDEKVGRYLVAATNIKIGSVVLEEYPLITGPSQITGPVCLSCLNSITTQNRIDCQQCGWPMCSKIECQQVNNHRAECDWTTNIRKQKVKIQQFVVPHRTYECITAIRCLYQKTNNPVVWNKLINLESHCVRRRDTEKYTSDQKFVAQFLHWFFKISPENFSEKDILKICGIIQVNAHEIPLTDVPHVAIYELASMLEHSCYPNCCKSFTVDERLIVRAVQNIKKGDRITISYTDSLWGTINRREHLAFTKYFYCECKRCVDPTELSTYYSSLKCFDKRCDGYVIPRSQMGDNFLPTNTSWTCDKCSCQVPTDIIDRELNSIGRDFALTDKQDPNSCQKFIRHYTENNLTLHPNHYFLTNIRLKLAQLYGQTEEIDIHDLSDEDLRRKIKLCDQILNLAERLFPAEWRIRGVLCFEMHAAVAVDAKRNYTNDNEFEMLMKKLTDSKRYLEDSLFFLRYEPEILPEGKMAQQAEKNLTDLNILLTDLITKQGINNGVSV